MNESGSIPADAIKIAGGREAMRLIYKDGKLIAHFTVVGEIEDLAEREEGWVPIYLVQSGTPIGEIQTRTHEVRLFAGQTIQNRQVVVLGKELRPLR